MGLQAAEILELAVSHHFVLFSFVDQSGHEASGGLGVFRGGYSQQWPGCSGDHGQQTQQGASEAHEGTEYSQTGQSTSGFKPTPFSGL